MRFRTSLSLAALLLGLSAAHAQQLPAGAFRQITVNGFTITGVGTSAGTVAAGNDSRFLSVGTSAGTVAAGNDSRFLASPVPVANGGTACSAASGTCVDNVSGFASTGILSRTGAGAYSFSTISGLIDALGAAQGNVLYRSATGWTILAPGTAGMALTTGGAAANPAWAAVGNVTGAASAVSGNVVTMSGTTGKLIADSGKALPAGAIVGTTDTQTLTGKSIAVGQLTGTLPVANGGTNCAAASGTCLDNVTGFAATGILSRTGAGTYTQSSLSTLLDVFGPAQGSLLYRGAAGWVVLAPGSSGQVLQSGGVAANPTWLTVAGGGNVTGPGTAAVGNVPTYGNTAGTSLADSGKALPTSAIVGVSDTQTLTNKTIGVAQLTGTLPIANGGTGQTTGAFVRAKLTQITATGTFTPQTGTLYADVICVGGGAGGGGVMGGPGTAVSGGAGGGGSGSVSEAILTAAQIGASQTVTIGGGGAASAGGVVNGSAGTATSFGTLVVANGGGGGQGVQGFNASGGVGGSVTGAVGDFKIPGVQGNSTTGNSVGSTVYGFGGNGASSPYGSGAQGAACSGSVSNGTAASGYGSGGSGACVNGVGAAQVGGGGAGSAGMCNVVEFIRQ